MGSCFSKGSGSGSGSGGNFRGEGHVLGGGGSAPAAAAAAARPAPALSTAGGGGYGTVNASASSSVPPSATTGGIVTGGRTLGGASEGPRTGEAGTQGGSDDPKSKAAQAAMARFQRGQGSGADLSKKLRAQKGMTRDALLKEESERERARRAADQAAEARSYS